MIPSKLAFTSGIPLNMKRSIVIGASVIETEAFIIERIKIDSLEMNSVFMLAANFKGELADTVLLGLNVLNNWKYTVHRRDNLIEFNESYPDMIPNNTNPYRNYFDSYGRYVLAQES
jgi:hypothetical protein